MEYAKIILNLIFLATIIFTLVYNCLYLVRIRTSDYRIGISAPKAIKNFLIAAIIVSFIALIVITVFLIRSVASLAFSDPYVGVTFPHLF